MFLKTFVNVESTPGSTISAFAEYSSERSLSSNRLRSNIPLAEKHKRLFEVIERIDLKTAIAALPKKRSPGDEKRIQKKHLNDELLKCGLMVSLLL